MQSIAALCVMPIMLCGHVRYFLKKLLLKDGIQPSSVDFVIGALERTILLNIVAARCIVELVVVTSHTTGSCMVSRTTCSKGMLA